LGWVEGEKFLLLLLLVSNQEEFGGGEEQRNLFLFRKASVKEVVRGFFFL